MTGGMLSDERSVNMVQEMLGLIPGTNRSYISSATGSFSLGGTPLAPQALPIHSANSITGVTWGAPSIAAQVALSTNAALAITTTTNSTTATITAGAITPDPTVLTAGSALYVLVSGVYTYVGTIKTTASIAASTTPTITLVNYPQYIATASQLYYYDVAVSANIDATTGAPDVAFTYDFALPTTSFPTPNASYTVQAGDDFEQDSTTYAKCQGFSVSGGSGGAIDMNASYMSQAVKLGLNVSGSLKFSGKTVTGIGTSFVAMDVGRKLYTTDNVLLGTIATVASATSVALVDYIPSTYNTTTTTSTNTLTATAGSTAITFSGTPTGSSLVGCSVYTTSGQFIGTVATATTLTAAAVVGTGGAANYTYTNYTTSTQISFCIGGFSNAATPTPIEDLIFARSRLYIDNITSAFPVTAPTPVAYQFLAFSYGLQCTWTPKFTGEGYQGIDPSWSFALFTNYSVSGDFTVEHDVIASGKYSASSVESLKYAWRNQVPKYIQVDCPGSKILDWFTPNATTLGSAASGTIGITQNTTTITGAGTSFTSADVGKDIFYSPSAGVFTWVGRVSAYTSGTSVTLAANYTGTTLTAQAFYLVTVTQPYFPVAGFGPVKTYTGVSFRCPVLLTQVSPISDQEGNDIVTVSWQMVYNTTAASAGDVRIVNQIPTIPVAG